MVTKILTTDRMANRYLDCVVALTSRAESRGEVVNLAYLSFFSFPPLPLPLSPTFNSATKANLHHRYPVDTTQNIQVFLREHLRLSVW